MTNVQNIFSKPYYLNEKFPHIYIYTVFDLITAPALITAPPLTFYYIFTYHRPLDDLLALVVENKFT